MVVVIKGVQGHWQKPRCCTMFLRVRYERIAECNELFCTLITFQSTSIIHDAGGIIFYARISLLAEKTDYRFHSTWYHRRRNCTCRTGKRACTLIIERLDKKGRSTRVSTFVANIWNNNDSMPRFVAVPKTFRTGHASWWLGMLIALRNDNDNRARWSNLSRSIN